MKSAIGEGLLSSSIRIAKQASSFTLCTDILRTLQYLKARRLQSVTILGTLRLEALLKTDGGNYLICTLEYTQGPGCRRCCPVMRGPLKEERSFRGGKIRNHSSKRLTKFS